MWEPLRQTGFVTTTVLILSSLLVLLLTLISQKACGEPPAADQVPYHTATRPYATDTSRWPNFGALLESRQSSRPHPAVARIIVPEGRATAYGTGTLIDVREGHGLVVTNWHVVREATGVIEVVFPNGFRSQARALKVDRDWDLAALVIWQPPAEIEPVALSKHAPRPGDRLTIHGYGQGDYRMASGQCTQYYAPRADYPQEMVELNVEARQGDSGGPIFNDRNELAGVLFGAGQGTTIGSFGGRVESFLATLAPNIGQKGSGLAGTTQTGPTPAGQKLASNGGPVRGSTGLDRGQGGPVNSYDCGVTWVDNDEQRAMWPAGTTALAHAGWPNNASPSAEDCLPPASMSPWESATSNPESSDPTVFATEDSTSARSNLLEQAKTLLAIIGLVTVCIQIVRVVT